MSRYRIRNESGRDAPVVGIQGRLGARALRKYAQYEIKDPTSTNECGRCFQTEDINIAFEYRAIVDGEVVEVS